MHHPTRFMDLYQYLLDNGVDVYAPAQHEGECIAPYVVIKDAGTNRYNNLSTTRTLYDVMCYVPKDKFTYLEQYVKKIKDILRGLEPMFMPLYSETSSYYDSSVKAYMVSMQYRNMKQIVK